MKKKIDNPTPTSTFAINASQPHKAEIAKELALPNNKSFPFLKKDKNTVNGKPKDNSVEDWPAFNKQFGIMAGKVLRLNILGKLKIRPSIEVY